MLYIRFSSLFSLTTIRKQIYRKVLNFFFIYLQTFQALNKNFRNNLINEFVLKKALIRDLEVFSKTTFIIIILIHF